MALFLKPLKHIKNNPSDGVLALFIVPILIMILITILIPAYGLVLVLLQLLH